MRSSCPSRPLRLSGVLLLVLGLAGSAASQNDPVAEAISVAAADWLDSLDDHQRRAALRDLDDEERFDLRLAPLFLEGLRRDRMSDEQWAGLRNVLTRALSARGLEKVETIMSLEREVLQRDERAWFGGLLGRRIHGEQRYFALLFGEPDAERAWGMRLDGHHLSLNWTLVDGRLSATPLFLGAEPREVAAGWERGGLRALAEEEDRGSALWRSLDASQRAKAQLELVEASGPAGARRPLFVGEGAQPGRPGAVGVARSELSAPQQELLDSLIDVYLDNLAAPFAAERRAAIDAAGRAAVRFAWAGSGRPGEPAYYRVQGPTFLIEFDNTVHEADHVHTIWREFDGDFGRDLLAEHYQAAHRLQVARRLPRAGR